MRFVHKSVENSVPRLKWIKVRIAHPLAVACDRGVKRAII